MGSFAIVQPEFAKLILDKLGLEINKELKKSVSAKTAELVILLDDKVVSPDEKSYFINNKSSYVIANDGFTSLYLAIRYTGEDEKGKIIQIFEPLEKTENWLDKQRIR